MIRALLSHPLLARELTERAARRRTYAGRVLYGLALYTLFLLALWRLIGNAANDPTGFGVLGLGRGMFTRLVELQCWGVLLFQPALMAGVLTYEKERESFSLLLLTGMSPTKLLLEKYLAGLLPMATLLLLALPLGAITMGYGGVSPRLLAAGAAVVIATWLHTGAFALLCSAWCRTTVGALLASYLGGALVHLAAAIGYSLAVRYVLWGADLRGLDVPGWLWSMWPSDVFQRVLSFQENAAAAGADSGAGWAVLFQETARQCAALLASTAVFLLLARFVMLPRALAGNDGHPALSLVRITRAALLWTRSLHMLWQKKADLPDEDPVAWREGGRSLLGSRERFREVLAIAAGCTLALALLLAGIYPRTAGPERLQHLGLILGGMLLLLLIVRSIGTLLSEHANQTLDILLTTPLGAKEILRQKAEALRHYWVLAGVVLGVVFAMKGWCEYEYTRSADKWSALFHYWTCSAMALMIIPALVIWISLFFGMWLRVRARAIFASLGFFAVWFIAPLALAPFFPDAAMSGWVGLVSPLGLFAAIEHGKIEYYPLPIYVWFTVFIVVLRLVRFIALRAADRLLRRGGRGG